MAGVYDVAVVGSGFAGSILARILARRGLRVVLVERGHHPRFALGESSTPLAALSLERLAARWDLPDLHALAAWGRWRRRLPHLQCGLKRGFTFYRHRAGQSFTNGVENESRLLVAASPNDQVADGHWLRADVDAHLVREAVAGGVTYLDRTELDGIATRDGGFRLVGRGQGGRVELTARQVVDASGGHGFLTRELGLGERPVPFASGLVYAHFEGLASFPEMARAAGARLDPGPFPDEAAAVHHLLDEGWLYVLPFDGDRSGRRVASCGLVLRGGGPGAAAVSAPGEAWDRVLSRYPTLAHCFAGARPVRPLATIPRLQYRRATAAGEGFYLLPHSYAFFDPLFSTGIAWSLLAVERLVEVVCGEASGTAYGELLETEADWIENLVAAAYRTLGDFPRFTALSFLYFAAASFAESRQRLHRDLANPHWEGFLGSRDPVLGALPHQALERLRGGEDAAGFERWLLEVVAPRDVAGLGDPSRRNLYPLDLEILVERCHLLGLSAAEVRAALPRLRGG